MGYPHLTSEEHRRRYQLMLEYQQEIFPFTPTLQELAGLWGLKSKKSVYDTLRYMMRKGWVLIRKVGSGRRYYAYDKNRICDRCGRPVWEPPAPVPPDPLSDTTNNQDEKI